MKTLAKRALLILTVCLGPGSAAAQCVDYGTPEAASVVPVEVTVAPEGDMQDVAIDGTHAWLVRTIYGGLVGVDIADPPSPVTLGSVAVGDEAFGVAIEGDLACVVYLDWSAATGMRVVDLSDPMNPALRGVVSTVAYGVPYGVAVSGGYAYLAMYSGGLGVVDLADPDLPELVGVVDTPGLAMDVAVSGGLAFVAERVSGLQIVDVSVPGDPRIVGSHATSGDAQGITVQGDLVYVAASAELEIFDVSDPSSPVRVGGLATPGMARAIDVRAAMAYVADNQEGVLFVDVSTPENPTAVGVFPTASYTHRAIPVADHVLISDAKLMIVPDQCPSEATALPVDRLQPVSVRAFPNPFNPTTVIEFTTTEPGPALVRIYALDGSLVRVLADAPRAPGTHRLTWDGTDDGGRSVSSGAYFARLTSANETRTAKLTCLK